MLNLELSEQKKLLRKTWEDFALKEIRPKIRNIEKRGVGELRIYGLGLFGVEFPEKLGGAGLGMTGKGDGSKDFNGSKDFIREGRWRNSLPYFLSYTYCLYTSGAYKF